MPILQVPVTIYQTQNPEGMNASLAFTPGEAHIILRGLIISKFSANELRALLAHELGHMLFYTAWDGGGVGDILTNSTQIDFHAQLDRTKPSIPKIPLGSLQIENILSITDL